MAVTLKNKRRRLATFNLEAAFFKKRTTETRYGQPEAITFLPLEAKAGLPDAILGCEEIKSAIARGDLRQMESKDTPAPPAV